MKIAFTMAAERGGTDLLLATVAQKLSSQGLRLAGTVQVNTERGDTCEARPCDMDVLLLPDGPRIRISQSLGMHSKGCRLDPTALESAVGYAEVALAAGADCLLVNKFGRHEAEGRGFRNLIAEALAQGIPVLVGLNALNEAAFAAFTDGMAVALDPSEEAVMQWVLEAARQ